MPGARPGHPRLNSLTIRKTWMAGTSPAMTENNLRSAQNRHGGKPSPAYLAPPFWYLAQRFNRRAFDAQIMDRAGGAGDLEAHQLPLQPDPDQCRAGQVGLVGVVESVSSPRRP